MQTEAYADFYNCTITGNEATSGGAVNVNSGTTSFVNTTFTYTISDTVNTDQGTVTVDVWYH